MKKPTINTPMFSAIERPLTERVDVSSTLEESLREYRHLSKTSRALVQHVDLRKIIVLYSIYEKSGGTKMEDETVYFPELNYGGYFVISDEDGKNLLRKYKTLSGAVKANPSLHTLSQTSIQIVREVIVDQPKQRGRD